MRISPLPGAPLSEMKNSLRRSLGVSCFIRRCRSADALFVSDASLRTDDPLQLLDRLSSSGSWCAQIDHGLLKIDPSPSAWLSLMRQMPYPKDLCPKQTARPILTAWALRLCLADTPAEQQPYAPLRQTLKRLDAKEYDLLEAELPKAIALIQRQHKPLPTAAGRYILYDLEAISC